MQIDIDQITKYCKNVRDTSGIGDKTGLLSRVQITFEECKRWSDLYRMKPGKGHMEADSVGLLSCLTYK